MLCPLLDYGQVVGPEHHAGIERTYRDAVMRHFANQGRQPKEDRRFSKKRTPRPLAFQERLSGQKEDRHLALIRFVRERCYPDSSTASAAAGNGSAVRSKGSEIKNVVPLPTALSTEIDPRWS